jgi:hypothetical protein
MTAAPLRLVYHLRTDGLDEAVDVGERGGRLRWPSATAGPHFTAFPAPGGSGGHGT